MGVKLGRCPGYHKWKVWNNNDTIMRSIVRSDCPPKEETSEIQYRLADLYLRLLSKRGSHNKTKGKCRRYRLADLDLMFCPRRRIMTRQWKEKCTVC